jgi:hypothetical protein
VKNVVILPRLLAFAAVLAVFGCSESTSPENSGEIASPAAPPASVPATSLQAIGASLVDATDWVLIAIPDDATRSETQQAIKVLADDLVAGRNDHAKAQVSSLRSTLESLRDLGPALGPIGVALDQIESEFGKPAQ